MSKTGGGKRGVVGNRTIFGGPPFLRAPFFARENRDGSRFTGGTYLRADGLGFIRLAPTAVLVGLASVFLWVLQVPKYFASDWNRRRRLCLLATCYFSLPDIRDSKPPNSPRSTSRVSVSVVLSIGNPRRGRTVSDLSWRIAGAVLLSSPAVFHFESRAMGSARQPWRRSLTSPSLTYSAQPVSEVPDRTAGRPSALSYATTTHLGSPNSSLCVGLPA